MELVPRFFKEPGQSYFLFGPRGTGKSTWLKMRHDNALFIDLLAPEVFREYAARPERLRDVAYASGPGKTIVIDEIQKLPVLLDVVHQLMEEHRGVGWRFIMTGSSARKLKRSGVDLLAGRAAIKHMYPFMAGELGAGFALERALRNGMVPLVLNALDPREALRAYIALYLREEVQSEIHGPALEGLIAQHLRAWCGYREEMCELYFWRTRSGLEVDFVLYGESTFWAIEVKNSETIHPKMLNGLLAFKKDYPQAGALLLYRGRERLVQKGVLCISCDAFLRALTPGRSIKEAAGA